MTHPITTISDKEINDKINDVLFQLREEAIVRDGDTISSLSPEQYQHVVVRLVRECIILGRINLSREKLIDYKNQQLEDIRNACIVAGSSVRIIRDVLKREYEGE